MTRPLLGGARPVHGVALRGALPQVTPRLSFQAYYDIMQTAANIDRGYAHITTRGSASLLELFTGRQTGPVRARHLHHHLH